MFPGGCRPIQCLPAAAVFRSSTGLEFKIDESGVNGAIVVEIARCKASPEIACARKLRRPCFAMFVNTPLPSFARSRGGSRYCTERFDSEIFSCKMPVGDDQVEIAIVVIVEKSNAPADIRFREGGQP